MHAYPIEVVQLALAFIGLILASINVRESVLDMRALVTAPDGHVNEYGIIALERLFTAMFVMAAQIALTAVGIVGVFSAPPPPGIETMTPTPFRAPFLMLQMAVVAVSFMLAAKSFLRWRYRRKLYEERST